MNDLIAILHGIRPVKGFAEATNFFDEGLLDSLDLTTLIAELEGHYGIFIDVDEMLPANFCNISAIERTLARKGVILTGAKS